ncbi:MAG: hypothetical protein HY010_11330 [Acidobacteria bacterium]|nr:hypothetical protein [Acidobacteriota bacterium]
MTRTVRAGIICLGFMVASLAVPIAGAKQGPEYPRGPIPVQVTAGKKVFISYMESDADPGSLDLTYHEFYALVKSWGKYELVPAPADADLVFQIRYVSGITDSQLLMSIVDPKTHVVLWPFVQHVEGSSREKGRRKKFDAAMSDLVNDLKTVTTPAVAP